ncbi:MAG: AraC family transcriptional regulator [Verrucomicrobiae bacterium]|nr:AraC family transcriptional regulator [Verrucomicrobiae bacterium]
MEKELLLKHNFQFISFCPVFHPEKGGRSHIHINDDSHLIHVTRGTGSVWIDHRPFNLSRGTVLSIPPAVEFYFDIKVPFEMLNIHYRVRLANGGLLDDHAILPLCFQPAYFGMLEKTLRKMERVCRQPLPESLQLASLAHEVVFQHLASNELNPRLSKAMDERVKKSCHYLLSPDFHPFDARKAAQHCCLSVSQMNRLFRRHFKLSPQKFWEKHRFTNIRLELKNADKTISQIAADFAFADKAYFSRWFKKLAGCPPSKYRNQKADLASLI